MAGDRTEKKGMELASGLAWQELEDVEVAPLAARCGARVCSDARTLSLRYLAWDVAVDLDERRVTMEGPDLNMMETVLILRYLVLCDGTEPSGSWITFRELPGGRNYLGPFLGRTARPLAERFGRDQQAFETAARALGGDRLSFGDSSFLFRLLPGFWLAIVLNLADDEFPAEVTILFDSAMAARFTTEDFAAAGQVLSRRLLREAG